MHASLEDSTVHEQQQRYGDQLHLAPATRPTAHFMSLMLQGSIFRVMNFGS
jgi:hypothetical protein